jgi:hypothetical protein
MHTNSMYTFDLYFLITGKLKTAYRVSKKFIKFMSTSIRNLIFFIVSVIAAMILIFAKFNLTIAFDSIKTLVFFLSAICLITISFLLYAAINNSKDIPFPLGLTNGSVRALIAVLALMFFICLSLIFYFNEKDTNQSDLAKSILTTLGTLVIAVSAFYFGSKATEQGSKIASDAFDKAKNQVANTVDNTSLNVPSDIIELALSTDGNKEKWKEKYKCDDIVVGKKQMQATTNNLNCLVFKVKSKDTPQDADTIPASIPFISNGKPYNIPTDVQLSAVEAGTATANDAAQQTETAQNDDTKELPADIDIDKKSQDN